jgi:hypothetical protein
MRSAWRRCMSVRNVMLMSLVILRLQVLQVAATTLKWSQACGADVQISDMLQTDRHWAEKTPLVYVCVLVRQCLTECLLWSGHA